MKIKKLNVLAVQIFDFVDKNKIFLLVLIYLFFQFVFSNILRGNELDLVVSAKHFMNKNWINNDWYLNLGIGYRYLFNFFIGGLALFLPLWLVVIIGRSIIVILFAFLFQKIANLFKLRIFILLTFLFVWIRFQSIVAGEWMINSLETKPFAYFFSILSLAYFIEKKYIKTFLFTGLSLSFHTLIGLFSSFSLFLVFIMSIKNYIPDINKLLKSFPLFFVTGIFGIFSIIKVFFENKNINKKLAGEIYVKLRVPHHTLPSYWLGYQWFIISITLVIILILFFSLYKDHKVKIFSLFALSTIFPVLIGMVLFYTNNIDLLKFYWFRFADSIIPFITFLLSALFIQETLFFLYNKKIANKIKISPLKITTTLSVIASLLIIGHSIKAFAYYLSIIIKADNEFYLEKTEDDLRNSLVWINKNTPKDSTLLVYPYISESYIVAERAIFVSVKHSPQSEKDILEWYNRLNLCNGGKKLPLDKNKARNELEMNYYNLNQFDLDNIISKYDMDYYLTYANSELPYEKVYNNNKYSVYNLKTIVR